MPANVRFEWNGDEAERIVRRRLFQFISSMCVEVKNHAKRMLSVAGRVKYKIPVRSGKSSKLVTIKKVIHAPKGEPPYKQTGRLRASVASEVDEASLTGRVGTNVIYGRILELTNHPWLRRSLAESQGKVDAIAAKMGEQS